jgi:hypothetical protein
MTWVFSGFGMLLVLFFLTWKRDCGGGLFPFEQVILIG